MKVTRKNPKLILFDWDNTLGVTRQAIVNTMNHVLKKYELDEWDILKRVKRDKTKSFKDNFPNFFGSKAKQAYDDYINHYLKTGISKVSRIIGGQKLLTELQDKKIKIGILSNKDHILLDKEVATCFPKISFEGIWGNGDFAKNKPYPEPIVGICKRLKLEQNSEIWLVGDSSQDTNCAISSGIQGVLFGKGHLASKFDIEQIKKHNIIQINKLEKILEFIDVSDF